MAEHTVLWLACGCRFETPAEDNGVTWCPKHDAADDLLAACEAILATIDSDFMAQCEPCSTCTAIQNARAAIQKARGET